MVCAFLVCDVYLKLKRTLYIQFQEGYFSSHTHARFHLLKADEGHVVYMYDFVVHCFTFIYEDRSHSREAR